MKYHTQIAEIVNSEINEINNHFGIEVETISEVAAKVMLAKVEEKRLTGEPLGDIEIVLGSSDGWTHGQILVYPARKRYDGSVRLGHINLSIWTGPIQARLHFERKWAVEIA